MTQEQIQEFEMWLPQVIGELAPELNIPDEVAQGIANAQSVEEVDAILNEISQVEGGQEILSGLINAFDQMNNSQQQMMKIGGKIDYFVEKFRKGGKCCKKENGGEVKEDKCGGKVKSKKCGCGCKTVKAQNGEQLPPVGIIGYKEDPDYYKQMGVIRETPVYVIPRSGKQYPAAKVQSGWTETIYPATNGSWDTDYTQPIYNWKQVEAQKGMNAAEEVYNRTYAKPSKNAIDEEIEARNKYHAWNMQKGGPVPEDTIDYKEKLIHGLPMEQYTMPIFEPSSEDANNGTTYERIVNIYPTLGPNGRKIILRKYPDGRVDKEDAYDLPKKQGSIKRIKNK